MTAPQGSLDRYQRRCGVVLLALSMTLLLGLGGRLVQINLVDHDRLVAYADRQQQGESLLPARRGMVLDTKGRVVAATEHLPDVFVDPSRVENLDAFAAELSPRVNLPVSRIVEKIRGRSASQYVVIERRVDSITADAVRAMKHPAVGLTEHPVRSYPLAESMAHVLGWVGRDGHGLEGVELAFDKHLRGKDGKRATIRDARRRALRNAEDEVVAPIDGGHVVLTIDAEIQRIAEQALAETVEKVEAENGLAVVMSPRTGDILAMTCYPTFDPNNVAASDAEHRRNRAITDPVEPGSTFKPVIVSGALEGHHITPTEMFDCGMGKRVLPGRVITDVSRHGMLNVAGVITYSSNVGMSHIAEKMGNPALHATIRRFHFGERLGFESPGEARGLVRPLKRWGRMSTASVGMGYEIEVTPLQLITAFSAIVNEGTMLKPRIIKQLLSADGSVIRDEQPPIIMDQVVDPQIARYISRELMRSVVVNGSGKGAALEHYQVEGKTGTTKLMYKDRPLYEPGAYQGAFVGAAPLGREELVVLVMIRRPNPKIAYYGSAVAAPVVGKILGQSLPYLGVPPDEQMAASSP